MPGMFDNWMPGRSEPKPAAQSAPPTNGNGTNPNPNPQNENENNPRTNTDLIATIWDEQKNKPGEGDLTGSSPSAIPGTPGTGTGTPPAQKTDDQMRQEISAHLNQVGLGEFSITPEMSQKIQEGDFTSLTAAVNTRIQQSYMQAIQSSQKLFTSMLEQQLPKAVEEAVGKSKSFFEGDRLRSVMHKELPFTADPSIGPVAETVFRQFLTKGSSKDKALQLTKEYFDRVRQAMDPEYVPSNTGTKTTFRGNPRQGGEMGWLDVLKGN